MHSSATQKSPNCIWFNALPTAILDSTEYSRLNPGERFTIQTIANHCTLEPEGHLSGAWGGKALIQEIGCSERTFWRHIDKLEGSGLLVILSRGGTISGKNYGNIYAIPVARGALDGRKCRRERCRMVKVPDGSGRIHRLITVPGTQGILFPDSPEAKTIHITNHSQCHDDSTPLPNCEYPTVKTPVTPLSNCECPHCQNDTPSYMSDMNSDNEFMSEGVLNNSGKDDHRRNIRRRNIHANEHGSPFRLRPGDLERNTLTDDEQLHKLFKKLVEKRLLSDSEHSRFRVFCAAENALRIGSDPVKVFASMVNDGFPSEKWKFVTQGDEQSAQDRIKRFFFGHEKPKRRVTAYDCCVE